MDNRYLFNKVVLILRENNEDIEEYVYNCGQEGLAVERHIYGGIPQKEAGAQDGEKKLPLAVNVQGEGDAQRLLYITDNQTVAAGAAAAGIAVLGYHRHGAGQDFLSVRYVAESLSQVEEEYLNMVYMRAHGMPLTIAVTRRTVIREMTIDDLPAMYELYADEAVAEWVEPLYDYDRELEFTREYIDNMYGFYGYGLWLVFDRETKELIGRVGISRRCIDGEECCELGYIIKSSRQRQGIGTEVSRAVLNYATDRLGMDKMWLCAASDNTASLALAHKLGFELYGDCVQDGKKLYIYNKSLRQ